MLEEKKFLSLLQLSVPPETVLSFNAQVRILEMLGIVSNPELIRSMEMAVAMVPVNTAATVHGLIILLGSIVKHHPKSSKDHNDELAAVLKKFNDIQDGGLTFGTFLPICESLMKAIHSKRQIKPAAVKKAAVKKAIVKKAATKASR